MRTTDEEKKSGSAGFSRVNIRIALIYIHLILFLAAIRASEQRPATMYTFVILVAVVVVVVARRWRRGGDGGRTQSSLRQMAKNIFIELTLIHSHRVYAVRVAMRRTLCQFYIDLAS